MNDIAFIVLIGLLAATNVFWMVMCSMLINRLMSRNYFEFKQAKTLGKPAPVSKPIVDELAIDPADEQQAQQMNVLMGMV